MKLPCDELRTVLTLGDTVIVVFLRAGMLIRPEACNRNLPLRENLNDIPVLARPRSSQLSLLVLILKIVQAVVT